MKTMDKTLAEYEKMAENSNQLMEHLQKQTIIQAFRTVNNSMDHMVLVIRWANMELALLRTLEDLIRNENDSFNWDEDSQKVLLRLDDLRAELKKQQLGELDKLEPANE
jgi:hypothetical protein